MGLYSPLSAEYSATVRGEDDAQHLAQFSANHCDKAEGNMLFLIIRNIAGTDCLSDDGAAKGGAAGFYSKIERVVC